MAERKHATAYIEWKNLRRVLLEEFGIERCQSTIEKWRAKRPLITPVAWEDFEAWALECIKDCQYANRRKSENIKERLPKLVRKRGRFQ